MALDRKGGDSSLPASPAIFPQVSPQVVATGARGARPLLLLLLALFFWCAPAAEGFGQNKVQYYSFEWSYYQTEHFDVYFSQGGEPMARFAAENVERMYANVSGVVGHKLTERVPIILHNTHAEFVQTNVIPMALTEGIGGFTERYKNRIVMPFEGSYRDFYHVLQHEMVHAVVFNMLFGGPMGGPVQQLGGFPLWVNEGLAEFTSLGWDLNSEFFMIDATTFGYVAPPVADFGGFLAYKGGQLFFHFMETVYGKGTVTRFIQNLRNSEDIRQAFQKTTKTSLEEAGEIWLRELRRLYWPELGQRQYGKSVARRLTHHGRDQSFYNLQPSLSPNGEEIAFFSDRESWEAVYVLNVKTEKVTRAVIQGGKQGEHESFHSFKSGITWSPDGKSLAVVSKQKGRDVIHILDAHSGKVSRVLKPDVVAILSPNWSRDGKRIAFSGQKDGFADIYVYELEADTARRLTFDMANDDKPVFSPSGRWIAFESDRPNATGGVRGEPGAPFDSLLSGTDIYRLSVTGDTLELLAGGRWDEKMPSYGPADSMLVFVSNRSGLDNIYLWKDSAGAATARPLTNLLTGCFTPSWSQDGKQLAFSLFEAGGWDIYLMKDPLEKVMSDTLPRTRFILNQEDSAGFFRAPEWTNLSSYNADSLKEAARKAARAEKEAKKKAKRDKKRGVDPVAQSAMADSVKADSLRTDSILVLKTDSLRTLARVDSLRASGDSSRAQSLADSLKVVAPAKVLSKKDSVKIARDSVKAARDSARVAKERAKREAALPFLRDTTQYKNDSGFIERDYKTKWSFDGASAAVGVDNQYGAGGLAYLRLSDLMGDQQLAFALAINGQIENTSAYVQYSYLPHRMDFNVSAFREALEFAIQDQYGRPGNYDNEASGFGLGLSYPFSPYTRIEAGVMSRFAKRSRSLVISVDSLGRADSVYRERETVNSILPGAAWVHDNAQWGIVGPVVGRRMIAAVQYLPPLLQNDFSYVKADVDLRFYQEYFKRYTFAFRVSGGASEAVSGYRNPHTYSVGGESYTFNARYNLDLAPESLTELYFSDFDFPLRGYEFYDFRGTRKFLTNAEFRFPFVRELSFVWPVPFAITNVMGNLFVDYGGAWSAGDPLDYMGAGYGYGLRLNLGIFILKYTRARSIQGLGGYYRGARTYWSLGSEF